MDAFAQQVKEYVSDAVVFSTDENGKQWSQKSLGKEPRDYPSLMKYVRADERRRLALLLYKGLSGMLRADGSELDYLLVMQGDGGIKNCALLSLDEKGCDSLSQYKTKLEGGHRLLYDAIRRTPDFSASSMYSDTLNKRMSAVNCIDSLLCTSKGEGVNDYPLEVARLVRLIRDFSRSKAAGYTSVKMSTQNTDGCYCTISARCVKTLMLMMAFIIRNAVGNISISTDKCDRRNMTVTFCADIEKSLYFDMYFKTSKELLKASGVQCDVAMESGRLIINVFLPYTEGTYHSMSDIQEYYFAIETELGEADFSEAFMLLCGA